MDHAQASELFSSYWDHDLSPEESARLEEHFSSCLVCRREYEAFQKMLGGLGAMEKQIAPEGFADGVIHRLRKRSRGRFFGALDPANLKRVDRIPYELFSVLMLAILVAIYVAMQAGQPGRLHLP